jgi:hypothetical protein
LLKDCCPDLTVQLQNMVQEVEWVWSFWMTAISMNQSAWMTLNWTAHLLWYLSTPRSRVPLKVVLEIKLPEKSQVSGFDNERKGFVVRTCCSNRTDATIGHQKISPMPRADQLTHILFPHTLAMSSLQLQVPKNTSQSM